MAVTVTFDSQMQCFECCFLCIRNSCYLHEKWLIMVPLTKIVVSTV